MSVRPAEKIWQLGEKSTLAHFGGSGRAPKEIGSKSRDMKEISEQHE